MGDNKGRVVYSTGIGEMCPDCGWPKKNCQCSKQFDQPVPLKITAKLRMEKKGRGGKTVTTISGLAMNQEQLTVLLKDLKRVCGAGGAVKDGILEVQGDHCDVVLRELAARGIQAKRAGG